MSETGVIANQKSPIRKYSRQAREGWQILEGEIPDALQRASPVFLGDSLQSKFGSPSLEENRRVLRIFLGSNSVWGLYLWDGSRSVWDIFGTDACWIGSGHYL